MLRNQGSGTFAAAATYAVAPKPLSVAAADLNADGRTDIVAASYDSYNVSVLLNACLP